MKKHKFLAYLLLFPFAASVALAVWMLGMGALLGEGEANAALGGLFSAGTAVRWPLLPNAPTLRPVLRLLLITPEFYVMFWNTCALAFGQVLGQLLLGGPAAWAFSRYRFRWCRALFGVYLALMLLPFEVTMVPQYLALDRLGLLDTVWSVILPGAASTFPVFMMKRGFDTVPPAVTEAAELDGAGALTVYLRIGLPLALPGVLAAVFLGLIEAWNQIEQPIVFLRDKTRWPLTLFLANVTGDGLTQALAASVFVLLPVVLIFLCGQPYLSGGITVGAVKE